MSGRAYARELEQLRRIDRPTGQNNFPRCIGRRALAITHKFDAGRTPTFKENSGRVGMGRDLQISTPSDRSKIGCGRTGASTTLQIDLQITKPFKLRPVKVIVARIATLLASRDKGLAQRMPVRWVRHRQRTTNTMIGIRATLLVLRLPEIRQDIIESPTSVSQLPPQVIIRVITPHIDQPVDGTGPSKHLPARFGQRPIARRGMRFTLIEPIHIGVGEMLPVTQRNMNPRAAVLATRFEQQDRLATVLGQTIGQNASRTARAHDNKIKSLFVGHASAYASSETDEPVAAASSMAKVRARVRRASRGVVCGLARPVIRWSSQDRVSLATAPQ